MPEEVANSGGAVPAAVRYFLPTFAKNSLCFEKKGGPCYDPSLPLADTKWSLFWLHFVSIYAVYSVFMRLLEF